MSPCSLPNTVLAFDALVCQHVAVLDMTPASRDRQPEQTLHLCAAAPSSRSASSSSGALHRRRCRRSTCPSGGPRFSGHIGVSSRGTTRSRTMQGTRCAVECVDPLNPDPKPHPCVSQKSGPAHVVMADDARTALTLRVLLPLWDIIAQRHNGSCASGVRFTLTPSLTPFGSFRCESCCRRWTGGGRTSRSPTSRSCCGTRRS